MARPFVSINGRGGMAIVAFLAVVICGLSPCSGQGVPSRLVKTNIAGDLYNFSKYETLDDYTTNYQKYIREYRPGVSDLDVQRLAPLTMNADNSCAEKSGFVLVHGLSDSPFYMLDFANSIVRSKPCAVINMPILPGHALIPGASLEANNEQWVAAVDLAVRDLEARGVKSITMIGFSTGAMLSLHHVLNSYSSNKDVKLALFSPALDLSLPWYKALLLPILVSIGDKVNSLAYSDKYSDANPYKYESFSYKGAYELYKLTQKLPGLLRNVGMVENEVFVSASMDDSTIKQNTTLALVKKYFKHFSGVVYSNSSTGIPQGIVVVDPEDIPNKVIDLSHVSLPVAPSNAVYGKDAKVNYGCLYYENSAPETFALCQAFDKEFYYGETSGANLAKYPKLSRIQYNPKYDDLVAGLLKFVG